jgi:hypothetical protein
VIHHQERKHSKYSASGAERWFNCPGSVSLSEGLPDKESPWSREGTQAHEVLEQVLLKSLHGQAGVWQGEMGLMAMNAARFITGIWSKAPHSDLLVETRISLPFIHPEMFGTFDSAVVDYFGTLHVFDYKYGAGHSVSPTGNLQMIFYGIGLAAKYNWNFSRVRLWIIQPRIRGYDGPTFWELPIEKLKSYVRTFVDAVRRVENCPDTYNEGPWCHWCKAKTICPLKNEQKLEKAKAVFS